MKILTKNTNNLTGNFYKIGTITILSVVINTFVYMMGGTSEAWVQLNIVIIIIASYFWNLKGCIIVALVLGLIVGPLMPLNVSQGIMQNTVNWIFRLLIYLLIGFVLGYINYLNKNMQEKAQYAAKISPYTGLYNVSELLKEIDRMIENKEKFRLIFINVVNMEDISKYINYTLIKKLISELTDYLKVHFERNTIYSSHFNQYCVLVKGHCNNDETQNRLEPIKEMRNLGIINNYNIRLVPKIGVVDIYNFDTYNAQEIFNRARMAADQGSIFESGIYYYDDAAAAKNRLFLEVSALLKNAIANDEFYIVYQPIIDINENKVSEAEVLVRWDRGDKEIIGPDVFIEIAEKTGQIKDLSKNIIEKNIIQTIEWQNKGLDINTSVNLTGDELLDEDFYTWIKNLLDRNHINRKCLGIEITERKTNKTKEVGQVMSGLIDLGYNILIDDFGTGYNTFMTIGEIPYTIIKIDKYFIDRIYQIENKILVKHIINAIHDIDKKVIAEGVETMEQYEILKDFGCDKIQGYYFSKPLLPNEFEKFYTTFNIDTYKQSEC